MAPMIGPTPGPWEVVTLESGGMIVSAPRLGNIVICQLFFVAPCPAENADLIAAAPDMLAALHEVESFLDDQADADDGRPNDAMRHLMEVRAAIAKAEGRA